MVCVVCVCDEYSVCVCVCDLQGAEILNLESFYFKSISALRSIGKVFSNVSFPQKSFGMYFLKNKCLFFRKKLQML